MPYNYDNEYPELRDWDEDTYEMRHFTPYPVMCFPYSYLPGGYPLPMPVLLQTAEGPVFIRYARNGTRPVMNCYPNLCYPIYITHK